MSKRPIALLTDDVLTAVTWAHNHLKDITEISVHNRFIATKLNDYIICTSPEHLRGMKIKDYRDVGGWKEPSEFYIEMMVIAKQRMMI